MVAREASSFLAKLAKLTVLLLGRGGSFLRLNLPNNPLVNVALSSCLVRRLGLSSCLVRLSHRQACRQAGRQAVWQAGKQAGRLANQLAS